MATPLSYMQRMQVAEKARKRFVADAERALVDLGGLVQDRLTALLDEKGMARELQARRDAWMGFQKLRPVWIDGTMKAWQEALKPGGKKKDKKQELSLEGDGGLSLVGTDAVENKILVSRIVMAVSEKVGQEFDDARVRIKFLESRDDLEPQDILRPDELIHHLVDQWTTCGMSRESWPLVSDVVLKLLIEKLKPAYANVNEFLIQEGVMPTIDLKDRVKRAAVGRRPPGGSVGGAGGSDSVLPDSQFPPSEYGSQGWASSGFPSQSSSSPAGFVPSTPPRVSAPAPLAPAGRLPQQQAPGMQPMQSMAPQMPAGAPAAHGGGRLFGGRLGWDDGGGAPRSPAMPGGPGHQPPMPGQAQMPMQPAMGGQGVPSNFGGAHEETRLMTQTTPLARQRSRAQGMFGQIKRLFVGQGAADFGNTAPHAPSPGLAAAMAERPQYYSGGGGGTGTVYEDYSPAAVVKVSDKLREKTDELKKKAETKSEKAVIEMVALMFQAILAEERIPPAVRVWFARLQMPVLRVALAEPEFFGTLNHPARQLIDRMGSCVMGFDASNITGSALETEIKRIVQVIEQYPETGKRVFQIVYDEFQKFLAKFLTGKEKTQKVVSVAQQVEQKETLAIQYTIELRNMLKDIPVRDEIRTFLFKVWAEVLAVSAVRKGPKDAETVALKKAAADLVWSASAKPNRNDRARVIQDLPQLLQRLRSGMNLLGMPQGDQDAHIKIVSDTMADAFMSKTQAIPQAQIDAMTQRLANLEDFVSEDGLGDLPLDAESIEMMLGIDASTIDVVTNGGSKPTPAMTAWAQELQLGSWFTLDHNGKVNQVQFVWRSDRKHLNLFASSDGHSYLIQAGRLAAYLQAGLLLPQEEETLTVRATREALTRLEANPERLFA